ncbi:type I pullulanase [Arcanobacterium hippocoleae]|uniref:type I pullulanase n=1 Tax=Arcanobacterium hippocoleae TaxID=149017 RepID=UPI0036236A4B
MRKRKSKNIFTLFIAILCSAFGITAIEGASAQAFSNQDMVWLTFKPDPAKAHIPDTQYLIHVWNDGAQGIDVMFTGKDQHGNYTASFQNPDPSKPTVNLIVHHRDPNNQENKWLWQTKNLEGIKPGWQITVSYDQPDKWIYDHGGPDAPGNQPGGNLGDVTPAPGTDPGNTGTAENAKNGVVNVKFTPDPNVPAAEYNLWVWGLQDRGRSVKFTGKDQFGRLTVDLHPLAPASTINLIVRRSTTDNAWAWQTEDLKNIPVSSTAVINYQDRQNVILAQPGAEMPVGVQAPTAVAVKVHYIRYDEDYTGWNVWSWLPPETNGRSTDFGAVGNERVATINYTNQNGIDSVGLIVRQSTDANEWAQKNTKDDLTIRSFPNGKAEVWIVQGNPVVFYANDHLPEKPEPVKCAAMRSKEFHEKYTYEGELGAIYTPQSTKFRLWAPTAESVQFVNYSQNGAVTEMKTGEKGTWEIELSGDQAGTQYNYRLKFADGKINESVDPYARSATANGTRSVVIDPSIGDAGARMAAFGSPQNAVIYEAHVRDLTIHPNNGITHKGKFLGLAETGTKTTAGNPAGLDYIAGLGVTHVQLLPIYDFGSVDETGNLGYGKQYNWGYDPVNYNVPEGSYSTDPLDPMLRVKELKSMIKAMHEKDLRVIMDVVYNHVYNVQNSPLEKTVPGYFFRLDENCNLTNGTGVGNETASEQPMMRKFIVDSVKYWAQNYQLDGFRFDLMGIHDVETMNQVRAALNQIDPSIIVLGEGWEMGNHPAGVVPSNYRHAAQMPGVAHFNDDFRDAVKGDNFTANNPGFISGNSDGRLVERIYRNVTGAKGVRDFAAPAQSVIYNEAHDNFTMYDKLKATLPTASDAEIAKRQTLGTSLQYIAQGVLFLHAGQEMLRTKNGDHNSYKSSDHVNAIDYDRAAQYSNEVQYLRGLNKFRAENSWLKFDSYEKIAATYEKLTAEPFHLAYKVKDVPVAVGELNAKSDIYVLANSAMEQWRANMVPAGKYDVLIRDGQVLAQPERITLENGADVAALRLMVLRSAPAIELAPIEDNAKRVVPWVELEPSRRVVPWVELEPSRRVVPWVELEPSRRVVPWVELEPSRTVKPWIALEDTAKKIIPWLELAPAKKQHPLLQLDPAIKSILPMRDSNVTDHVQQQNLANTGSGIGNGVLISLLAVLSGIAIVALRKLQYAWK